MLANRWEQIEQVFNEAILMPVNKRKSFVEQLCGADDDLSFEVISLLEADNQSDEILEQSVFPLVAQLLDEDFSELLEKSNFASYKLKKLLGKGGMGAVFLAEDTRLRRLVAIKVLPPALAQDQQSLSRFRQEARAASQLSHPNIAHIYEFGETNGRLFLAMEYVEGRTLRELVKEKAIQGSHALSIAKQVALALVSTHERGIIHRDIKPENIIVKNDGLVKVLDFGLAKLNEQKTEASVDGDALPSQIYTQSGMILGTVGYMSPEQIRGKELDASTDLWSLGVVLFEMLTGARPFQGETPSDVQAAILKDEPLVLNESESAANINQIIKKALSKNIAERYQTAAEFAEDIERVQLQSDSNFHDSHRYFAVTKTVESSVKNLSPASKTNGILRWQFVLPVVLILSAIGGWLIYQSAAARLSSTGKSSQMRMSRLTNSGNAVRAALSSDGKTLAYVLGLRGVFLRRRIASGTFSPDAITLVAPADEQQIRGLAFTPDGRQVFFRAKTNDDVAHHLFRVSVEGGEPQKVVNDVQSPPSFSPDGKQMVFLRVNEDGSRGDLIIADADGANERIFYTRRTPDFFSHQAQPAWSPDGETIVCSVATRAEKRERMVPLALRISDGRAQPILKESWAQIWTTQWLSDGKAFVMTGRPDKTTDNNQIWRVGFPDGEVTRLTDDFNDYFGVSVTNGSSGKAVEMISVILNRTSQLWKVNLANSAETPVQITQPGGDDGYGISWARDNKVFYGSTFTGNPDIWVMNADGADPRQLTFDLHLDSQPSVTPDGRYVIFGSMRSGIESLWRMNPDGSAQTLLVSDANREPLAVTTDGKMVYYHSNSDGTAMWRVPVEGGQPEKLIAGKYYPSAVSVDGKFLAASFSPEGAKDYRLAILTIEETVPRVVREFKPAEGANLPDWLRWSPNGKSIAYIVTRKGISNLYSQPLDGSQPKQLTNFTSNRIYSFDFSPDEKQIFCARGELSGYVALLTNE
ncbi:MAG: serine/threonine-protein kinase [Acidobacteriota bacterium]|nr:serine/threonine-protein kinase [Acidobacteriota bacterium]